MAMSIKEILMAQQRAANSCKKPKPVPYKKTVPVKDSNIKSILDAQRNVCKHPTPVAPKPVTQKNTSISDIIARQRVAAVAQKVTSGINPGLSRAQAADIAKIKEKYRAFLAKIEKELAAEEAKCIPANAANTEPVVNETPIFTPNVSETTEVVMESQPVQTDINGISVGEEMGGQVTVSTRSKRRRHKTQAESGE